VVVNCATLPGALIESELFGRERGAFTGAHATQIGRFELANRGTLFLDEIGELPLELQPNFLRVLQTGQLERLGSPRTIDVDVRVIAATNRDLLEEVRQARFRRDLFYRLNVFPITLPSLRERREDSAARPSSGRASRRALRKRIDAVPPAVYHALESYDWPGNIRELENVIQRANHPLDRPHARRERRVAAVRRRRLGHGRRHAHRSRASAHRAHPRGMPLADRRSRRRGADSSRSSRARCGAECSSYGDLRDRAEDLGLRPRAYAGSSGTAVSLLRGLHRNTMKGSPRKSMRMPRNT
jgi:transcriptional regulator with GAF, ATPase, and Fis domain